MHSFYNNFIKNEFLGAFKLVKIQLNGHDVRETIVKVLNACEISTTYIDKIPHTPLKAEFRCVKNSKKMLLHHCFFTKLLLMWAILS